MLESGSLPMSSAEMASMMLSESCLALSALSMLPRIPVTTTASRLLTESSDFFWAFSAVLATTFLAGAVCASAGFGGVCSCVSCVSCVSCADAIPVASIANNAVAQAVASGRMCRRMRRTASSCGKRQ